MGTHLLLIQILEYLISQLLHLVPVLILRRRPWLQFSLANPLAAIFAYLLLVIFTIILIEAIDLMFQRKWYRNFLMKGFHLVVLLAAGPGIRDTQVIV